MEKKDYKEIEKMREEIKQIFHNYCSGSIDENGQCYLHSLFLEKFIDDVINLWERKEKK